MKVRVETYWATKSGCSEAEFEDAFWPHVTGSVEVCKPFVHLAIADGATESSFSGDWARKLVAEFAHNPAAFYKDAELGSLLGRLGTGLMDRLRAAAAQPQAPWYMQEKAAEGAFAAMLGVTLVGGPTRQLKVWAVGDCCFFQIRAGELIKRFPLESAAEFGNRPFLLSSRPGQNSLASRFRRKYTGKWQHGDQLLLMTDAVACWFLRRWDQHTDPLGLLDHVRSQEDFHSFVVRERAELLEGGVRLLRNDDATLTRCIIGEHCDVMAG